MTKETILEQIQDHNDDVGSAFNSTVKEATERYGSGIIHHEEYINSVKKACDKSKEELIVIKYENI